MNVNVEKWSGEGAFTQVVLEQLRTVEQISAIRVEDAPASRSEADYNFISNEIFVTFGTIERREPIRRLGGLLPGSRTVLDRTLTLQALEQQLERIEAIGAPDYSDESMLQYLRTERVIPPYQTRGYKLVELVRIYEVR